MAHFYADIQGNRGAATRMGTKDSGIAGHIRGWKCGARVSCDCVNGEDVCTVTATAGSGYGKSRTIAQIYEGKIILFAENDNLIEIKTK